MAETLKVLSQTKLAATTLTDCYVVPTLISASLSSIVVCNQHATTDATFRIAISVAGIADNTKQYLYYDAPIPAASTLAIVVGVTLGAADVVRAYASTANISVNVFGVEIG